MKIFFNVLVFAVFLSSICTASIREIRKEMDVIVQLLEGGKVQEAQSHLSRSKIYEKVRIHIMEVASPSMGQPTRERMERIREVQATLEPYNKHLLQLAQPEAQINLSTPRAFSVLKFTEPSNEVRDSLLEVVQSTKDKSLKKRAFSTLANLRLFDGQALDVLKNEMLDQEGNVKSNYALGLAIEKAIPVEGLDEFFIKVLQQPYTPNPPEGDFNKYGRPNIDQQQGMYRSAADWFARDPEAYGKYEEEIQRALKKMEADKRISPYTVRSLQRCLAVLRGEMEPLYASASNGSGPIGLSSKYVKPLEGVSGNQRLKSSNGQKPLLTNKNEGDLRLPEKEVSEAEQSPSRLPWIIAGVLFVGILLLLFKVIKGKSTS
ncbi:MAG: hypothetical protein AAF546_07260 [Verrucomicrobiota bacterium]